MSDKVSIALTPSSMAILIRGLPHVIIRRDHLVGIESWIMSGGVVAPFWFIEFTLRDGTRITCDYDDRDLWAEILGKIAAMPIFEQMQGERS